MAHKILVVDNDAPILNMIQRGFQEEDYEITTCTSVQEGREADSRKNFALVITDNSAPVLNSGRDWARELEAAGRQVILMSARQVEDLGNLAFISKPFDFKIFRQLVRDKLNPGA